MRRRGQPTAGDLLRGQVLRCKYVSFHNFLSWRLRAGAFLPSDFPWTLVEAFGREASMNVLRGRNRCQEFHPSSSSWPTIKLRQGQASGLHFLNNAGPGTARPRLEAGAGLGVACQRFRRPSWAVGRAGGGRAQPCLARTSTPDAMGTSTGPRVRDACAERSVMDPSTPARPQPRGAPHRAEPARHRHQPRQIAWGRADAAHRHPPCGSFLGPGCPVDQASPDVTSWIIDQPVMNLCTKKLNQL